jgi:hypothetical protein
LQFTNIFWKGNSIFLTERNAHVFSVKDSVNYQRTNSRLPEMWVGETDRVTGEQARVLGETERILGEQAYEDVLATVIINKVK